MMEYEKIKHKIEGLLKPKRFKHSVNVSKEAVKLGKFYGVDERSCRIAGIVHDCAKHFDEKRLLEMAQDYNITLDDVLVHCPDLLHGPVGASYARDNFEIQEEDILNAISFHTTGRAGASLLEKIIYLADLIEESRNFPEIAEIRKEAYTNLDEALILACNCTLNYVMEKNSLIHPLTIEFRNSLLLKGGH